MSLLEVDDLRVSFRGDAGPVEAVRGIALSVEEGRTLGLVGESGSGKSVTSLAILRLLPAVGAETSGRVAFLGKDLVAASAGEVRAMRGDDLAMIFQEPMSSLNPVYTVGDQVAEAIVEHERVPMAEAMRRTVALFEEVGISDPPGYVSKYPHQLSGGEKQRVMIAMALSCDPRLLVADEPTTALDVTIQAQILQLLRRLRDQRGMAMLFITHDLGVIAEIADDVAVMYRGRIVETGPVEQVFRAPAHPYTRGLIACRPDPERDWRRLPTVAEFMRVDGDRVEPIELSPERIEVLTHTGRGPRPEIEGEPLLEVTDLAVWFPIRKGVLQRVVGHKKAVDGVSFRVGRGQTLGLVGESGCGKTTTGRAILRLVEPTAGRVRFRGRDWLAVRGEELRGLRRHVQIVFQDPYSSLNPRLTVEQALTEPMAVHGLGAGPDERRDRAAALLAEVGLSGDHLSRYPHEFSGGQRQRIVIARALAVEPELLVCDESVSALDVSVQAQVLNLLKDLQDRRGLTYVFVSHDLSVVKFMSDTMAVMKDGKIVEMGAAAEIWAAPREAYTRNLVAAIPKGLR
ncbi:MAG: ABC transporter ATP-binding protein [Myxococcota bacterium]